MSDEKKPNANWVSPSAEVHEERFGKGSFSAVAGVFGRSLKPLAPHYTPEQIAAHYREYLRQTPGKFLNIPRFAGTFTDWVPSELVESDGFLVD